MALPELWRSWNSVRNRLDHFETTRKFLEQRLRKELGDKPYLDIENGQGVYWEERTFYSVDPHEAELLVPNPKDFYQIVSVDMSKARKVLDTDTYQILESKQHPEKTVVALKTGKIKQAEEKNNDSYA